MSPEDLLGLPLADAEACLQQNGIKYRVVQYIEPYGHILGPDLRVIRAQQQEDGYILLVALFQTSV